MTRRPLILASALSLLLCIALAAMWVWSCFSYDVLHHGTGLYQDGPERVVKDWYVETAAGSLDVKHYQARAGFGKIGNVTPAGWQWTMGDSRFVWRPQSSRLGFAFHAERFPLIGINYHRVMFLRLPFWALVALTGAGSMLSYLFVHRATIRLRRASKLCVRCGYDLRATPDRCPECGTPVRVNSEAKA
ncbi:MAG TPA: hypothetical protein VGI81_27570 [Tepidisphaeraceae bacterium]